MADTILTRFLDAAARNADKTAYHVYDGEWRTLTFGQLSLHVRGWAGFLATCGITRGDRVAIVSENRPDWCAAYLAIIWHGAIAVPIDMQLGPAEIRNLLVDSQSKAVFCSMKTEAAVREAGTGQPVVMINFETASLSSGDIVVPEPVQTSPTAVASIIYTSGTTGNPKGVVLTHRNFCADADCVIQLGLFRGDDTILSVLPLHHAYPFMGTFIVPLFVGAGVVFSPGLKAADLATSIRDCGVTVIVGVPRLLEMIRNGILQKMKERRGAGLLLKLLAFCRKLRRRFDINPGKIIFGAVHRNFPRVRYFACGGARLDPEIMEDLEGIGFTILEGYGLTETAPAVAFNPMKLRKPGSVGVPFPGATIRITDDGEIAVQGPMVTPGYYRSQAATSATFRDGWFLTGDLGRIDSDGYIFITGRKKEVIVLSSGKNIYPEDVEKAFTGCPLIKEMAVVPVERNGRVDAIQAIIVPDLDYARQQNIGSLAETMRWEVEAITATQPEYQRIRGYVLASDPLPRTPLGKVRRFLLPEIFTKLESPREAADVVPAVAAEDATAELVGRCIRIVAVSEITVRPTDSIEIDLGFDSLKKIELLSSLEEALGVKLPDTFFADIQTVADLVANVRGLGDEGASGGVAHATQWNELLNREPDAAERDQVGHGLGGFERFFVTVVFSFIKGLMKLFWGIKVAGIEHLPKQGPYIIAVNHSSLIDGFVVAASLPHRTFANLYFLGIRKYFTGRFKGEFGRLSHVIPIDSESYANKALQLSAHMLRQGKGLCIFPEGGRSFTDEMMPFKKGIGIIAVEMRVPVIPAYIEGASRVLPRDARFVRFGRISIRYGRRLELDDLDRAPQPAGTDRYQAFADLLRDKVVALGPRMDKSSDTVVH